MEDKKRILFVCVENAGRSQMAEAFFKQYAPDKFIAISAGTKPSMQINPMVAQVMKEKGIKLNDKKPKQLSNDMLEKSVAVNMGCMDQESCPALFVDGVLDWNLADPKNKSIEEVRKIRDEIEVKVKLLVKKLQESQ